MSSSSPSSSSLQSKNSAFSRYSKDTNKSMCIVPKEWKVYPQQTLNIILCDDLSTHWRVHKKLEGVVIQVGGVPAKLEYNDKRIWMKRCGDLKSRPHPQEYVLTYIDKLKAQQN